MGKQSSRPHLEKQDSNGNGNTKKGTRKHMSRKKAKHQIQLLEISDIEPNRSYGEQVIDLMEDDSPLPEDIRPQDKEVVELTPATDSNGVQSREDGSKKTNSKSQSDEVSEVRQKPKQNNFIEMVEMQKKHERHHKVKIPGKHANHKLIPAQLVQDIAKG